MRYILSLILIVLCALGMSAARLTPSIVVLSDLHVVEPQQAQTMTLGKGERKLLTHSAELFNSVLVDIMENPPQVLVITGDLTDRGDLASHKWVASQLALVKAAGTTVLVIPGNHDIGKEVTREQFAQMYADYGYSSPVRDKNSLSYVCEPVKGLVVLGIDSNGDSGAAIKWAAGQAADYKGKNVIAMMHHHLIPHFLKEEKLLTTSVVEGSQASRDALMKAGVHLVFTGHTHIHDAAVGYNSAMTDSIIDVCTGSLAGYPHPYREITLKGNKLKEDCSVFSLNPYQDEARSLLEDAVPVMVQALGRKYCDKALGLVASHPMARRMLVDNLDWNMVSKLLDIHVTPTLAKIYVHASYGDESLNVDEVEVAGFGKHKSENPSNTDVVAMLKKDLTDGIIAVVQAVVRPQYREAAIALLAPAVEEQLMPIVNSILDDTNPPSTTAVGDCSFLRKKK